MSDVLGGASANGGQQSQSQSQHMLPMFQIADPVSFCRVGPLFVLTDAMHFCVVMFVGR